MGTTQAPRDRDDAVSSAAPRTRHDNGPRFTRTAAPAAGTARRRDDQPTATDARPGRGRALLALVAACGVGAGAGGAFAALQGSGPGATQGTSVSELDLSVTTAELYRAVTPRGRARD